MLPLLHSYSLIHLVHAATQILALLRSDPLSLHSAEDRRRDELSFWSLRIADQVQVCAEVVCGKSSHSHELSGSRLHTHTGLLETLLFRCRLQAHLSDVTDSDAEDVLFAGRLCDLMLVCFGCDNCLMCAGSGGWK
jgi:hypothetical protein